MRLVKVLWQHRGVEEATWEYWGEITVNTNGTFEEGPVCILDSRNQVLQHKTVRLVKVLWQHRGVEEATWER